MLCVGGPLNTWRLSVPTGLTWFVCPQGIRIDMTSLRPQGTEVVELESLAGIDNFSTTSTWSEAGQADRFDAYVRQSFVSGEQGIVHILRFQASPAS